MQILGDSLAVQRYLQRHIEPGLPEPVDKATTWHHALVIPAYREAPALLETLQALPQGNGNILVVLVLNRPETDPDNTANQPLRAALSNLPPARGHSMSIPLYRIAGHADLLLLDLEASTGPIPRSQGVGLARKSGCDLVLKWMCLGAISDQWIYCTDADATLPADYFHRLQDVQAPAATFPFVHRPGPDAACHEATALYELRLHQYVRGLQYAGSPYAFHTLGSCLAVQAQAYAQVRGFPKRAGAEDFYLLNKLAKTGPVRSLAGEPVGLVSRVSDRVPFGTGPAVIDIMAGGALEKQCIFYAPQVFEVLRCVLANVPSLHLAQSACLPELLEDTGLDPALASCAWEILESMALESALSHCRRQGKNPAQFLSQFHQWFDAFRTLKFIQELSRTTLPRISRSELEALQATTGC